MDIEAVKAGVLEGIATAREAIAKFVIWAGHKIRLLTADYLVPAYEKMCIGAVFIARAVQNIVKAGPFLPFTFASAFFLAGLAAFKIADHKAYEEEMLSKTIWKAIGVSSFTLATISTSLGIASLVLV